MKSENKYYVTMTDRFLSGWGMAEGKINKLVFVCNGYREALTVRDNARARTDQERINIRTSKPYYNPATHYVQYKTIDEYPNWYVPGYFKRHD